MNYKVTYYNDFTEPFYVANKTIGRFQNRETWILKTKEECILCVKDFLDVPDSEMTVEQIKRDFGSHEYPISDEKAEEIKEYYNGRHKIFQKFTEEFKTNCTLNYSIPEKFNSFSVADDDQFKQNDAYIKISITDEEI